MRPHIEQFNALVPLSPFRSWLDCTINTSGYDFRKGQGVEGRQVREMCEMGYGVLVSPVAGAWVLGSVIAGASESDCVDWGLVSAGNDCVLG